MSRPIRVIVASAIASLMTGTPPTSAGEAPAIHLDLGAPGWELEGEQTVVEEIDGRRALRLMTGKATYRGIELLDGTIEFELRVTPYRSFAYLYFRVQQEGEHEEIYFRPHKSRLPDAIQYTPVYRGSSQWQLYHDARSTAAAPLPAGEWLPVKVVVQGSRAAVFVGAVNEPQLVATLAREPRPGYLALRSFKPPGSPEGVHLAEFANFVVRPGVVDYGFPPAEAPAPRPGQISSWQLSTTFVPAAGLITELPREVLDGEWKTVAANADGLLELERLADRPVDARRAGVLARLRITAAEATTRRLDLGFSDEVSVFLNGRPLLADDESYSFNLPRRQGLLTGHQLTVFLPLARGVNELVLAVVDRFGGWGLSGRLEERDGLTVEASASPERSSGAAPQPDLAESAVARLAWLAGCWSGEAGEECWLEPRGGTMVGVNRGPERNGRPPAFELLRIVERDGGLVFLAQPGGRCPETAFPAVEMGDARVVFANPEHDFPQRITYWLGDAATLRARVEARQGSEWQGFDLTWTRASW